jgi:hypothetical protein
MGLKDKMKDAAAQAAVQARKAAEQAKDLAADVRVQAQEKWAEEQERRAADGPSSPASAASSTHSNTPANPGTPDAPGSDSGASWTASRPTPPIPPSPSRMARLTDAAARATVQARKSVEEAKGRATSAKGQTRDQVAARPRRPDLAKNKKALVALAGLAFVGIGGLSVAAIAENNDKDASASAPATESPTTKPTPAPTPTKFTPAVAPVVDTRVDALLDKLNNEPIDGPGAGPKTGDRFRIIGSLFEDDAWGPTASGDYAVMLKAKGGADDLEVLVDQSDAAKWANGTKVEMVLELVEVTIKGEKLNGFLRAVSVKTLAEAAPPKAQNADTAARMFKDLNEFADTFNTVFSNPPMIASIQPGSAPGVVYVNLHPGLLGVDVDLAQQAVSTMNEQLVDTIGDNDAFSGMVKYFIGRKLVGENHAILDPYSVSFKGGLDG